MSIQKMASLCRRWRGITLNYAPLFEDIKPWERGPPIGDFLIGFNMPNATIQLDTRIGNETPENVKKHVRSLVNDGFLRYAKCLHLDSIVDLSDLQPQGHTFSFK